MQQPSANGEHDFLEGIRGLVDGGGRGGGVLVGIGDDAAVVRTSGLTVLTTDTVMEGVHFRPGWLRPGELGVRAFRAAVSDVAAMGARPRYVLLSLEVPVLAPGRTRFDPRFATALIRGLARDARGAGAALVGGNIAAASCWALTVTVVGEARTKPVTRDGARAGDVVVVTGELGGAAAGVAALSGGGASPALTRGYRNPPTRVEVAAELAEAGLLHAMIDVSDGLLQDLGHLSRRSSVRVEVDTDAVPIHAAARRLTATREAALALAVTGGEDYELAMTVAARHVPAITRIAARHRCRVSVIGQVRSGKPAVVDVTGRKWPQAGFDHLRARRRR